MVLSFIRLFVGSIVSLCKEFKKPEIFCIVLVALYEAKINMVILPYLSAILVFIQNLDELNRSQVMPREKQAIRVKQSESNNLGYNRKY